MQLERPLKIDEVKSRAVTGIRAFGMRTIVSLVLRVISSICLAHLLFPVDYGQFGVAAYVTGLALYFSDVGLGGALVRQVIEPKDDEQTTVFIGQQVITGTVVALLVIGSPWITRAYNLPHSSEGLIVVMALGIFFNSLRVVPIIALERELRFAAIARCELVENIVQTVSTIVFALLGTGAWCFAIGGLLRGAVGLSMVWAASPWRPRGRFRWDILVRLAKYGIAFQLNAIAPTLLAGWMPWVVSRTLGVATLGLVNWAINLSSVPMMLSAVLNRVAFPTLSRIQSDDAAMGETVLAAVRRLNALLWVTVPVIVLIAPLVIPMIFPAKWSPAIPFVQWFSLETGLLTVNGLLSAAQNATGYAGDRLAVAVGSGLFRFALGYTCITLFGIHALGPTAAISAAVELLATTILLKHRARVPTINVPAVFEPIVAYCAGLGGAWLIAFVLIKGELLLQTIMALVIFIAFVTVREVLAPRRVLASELRGLLAMLGTVTR